MVIWTVSDVITLALLIIVIFGFMIVGMMYFIAVMVNKLSKWREKRWQQRHGQS